MSLRAIAGLVATLAVAGPALADLKDGLNFLARGSYGNAHRELKEAAEAGDAVAARLLGWMCERGIESSGGIGFEARPEEAVRWYRQAAEAGDVEGMRGLGIMLATGHGVDRNPKDAVEWLRKGGATDKEFRERHRDMPPDEQDDIASWLMAVVTAARRDIARYPHQALRRNAWGKVVVQFGATGEVKVTEGDAIDILVDHVENATRKALVLVPPSPAAIRNKSSGQVTVEFRIAR